MMGIFPTHCLKDHGNSNKNDARQSMRNEVLSSSLHRNTLQADKLCVESITVVCVAKYSKGVHIQCAKAFLSNI